MKDVLPINEYLPLNPDVGRHLNHAIDTLEERGLTRTCRADDPEDLVRGHFKTQVVEGGLCSVAHRHVPKNDVGGDAHAYHFRRERSQARSPMEAVFTTSTSPTRITAVPYCNGSETPITCVVSVKR